jgi:hypothetical protein
LVYVTGSSPTGDEGTEDIATIAYDAATGQAAWVARYDDPYHGSDQGISLRASPDGNRVYVAGFGQGDAGAFDIDWKIIAYDAITGEQIWLASYDGTGKYDAPIALAVSKDGDKLFATGQSQIAGASYEIVTVSLDPTNGNRIWTGHYQGPAAGFNSGFALAVSPRGDRVFVTGLQSGQQNGTDSDVITLGYDAVTGARLWNSSYNIPGYLYEWAHDIGVSRDGERVYVAGLSAQIGANGDYATLTYDASTGNQIAVDRYNGAAELDTCYGWSLALSPNDLHLFVAGVCYHANRSAPAQDYSSIVTVAYEVAPIPMNVVSRKGHGSAGAFDLSLPLTANPGIESRSGGSAGNYQIVFNFAAAVTVGSASVTSGTGQVDSYTVNGSIVTVNLSGVANAQIMWVTLSDVNDGSLTGPVSVPIGVLVGDVNASGRVDAADVSLVRQQTLQSITSLNFRADINASGRIDAADVSIARQQTLTTLP